MNPSVELRIRTMQRALTEVVIPALDPRNALAQEQARLLLGHLHALAVHHRDEARLDAGADAALARLAADLLRHAAGGDATATAAEVLRAALAAGDRAALSHALEALVVAAGIDGDAGFRATSATCVLAHGHGASRRGRAWFRAMGFDAAPDTLPTIADLLHEETHP